LNNLMEKKAKQFDKIVGEWKRKADGLAMDLDVTQKECRNASSELFRIKAAYEESLSQLDEVRRENKTLSNEIKDIMDQIAKVEDPSMKLIKSGNVFLLRNLSFKQLLKRQKVLLNKRKTRSCVLNLSSLKLDKKSSTGLLRRMNNSLESRRI